jgi:hypothetical protein
VKIDAAPGQHITPKDAFRSDGGTKNARAVVGYVHFLKRLLQVGGRACTGRLCLDGDLSVLGVPLDDTVFQGEEGVVAPDADILTRAHFGTALAQEDVPGTGSLPSVEFNAETLCV